MKTQLELARAGKITEQINIVARKEGLVADLVRSRVAVGEIVIARHPDRPQQKTVGIGTGLRTKVNASIGTSSDTCGKCARPKSRSSWARCPCIRPSRKPQPSGPEYLFDLIEQKLADGISFMAASISTRSNDCANKATATAGWSPRAAGLDGQRQGKSPV